MIKYFWRLYYFFYTPNGSMQIGKSAYTWLTKGDFHLYTGNASALEVLFG